MNFKTWFPTAILLLSVATLAVAGEAETPAPAAKTDKTADRKKLEEEFARTLTGATLVGHFTVEGKGDTQKPSSDRYEIESAEKAAGHRWIITARIKYGKHDQKVPVALDVFWAGDTPVMTLTKLSVPGFGTFTARILFYGDRYAGTWQHDKVGGHMWGTIERTGAGQPQPKSEPGRKSS